MVGGFLELEKVNIKFVWKIEWLNKNSQWTGIVYVLSIKGPICDLEKNYRHLNKNKPETWEPMNSSYYKEVYIL